MGLNVLMESSSMEALWIICESLTSTFFAFDLPALEEYSIALEDGDCVGTLHHWKNSYFNNHNLLRQASFTGHLTTLE